MKDSLTREALARVISACQIVLALRLVYLGAAILQRTLELTKLTRWRLSALHLG